MILGSLSDYLPLHDLVEILAVCLVVAVVAPSAVSISILGLDRRGRLSSTGRSSDVVGTALVALGVAMIAALIGLGLYALFTD